MLIRLQRELEAKYNCNINWDQLVSTFKYLNDAKAGALVTGKTADKHRFEWGVSLIDLAKAAKGEISIEAVRAAPQGKTRIVYPVGYRPKKKNEDAVRAKRKGVRGRVKGGKNVKSRSTPKAQAVSLDFPAPRVVAKANGQSIEVMVIEGHNVRRYVVPPEKSQGFMDTVLPAFAVAK